MGAGGTYVLAAQRGCGGETAEIILVSYACYIPVILFVQKIPAIGMLMIPKTIVYIVMAFIAYSYLYSRRLTVRPSLT